MDNKTPLQRKKNMTAVKSKDTKPELMLRKFLFSQGFRYRVNVKTLPGTPDIVLSRYKTAILVNGCFWHGHRGCKKAELPATNTEFWEKKIENAKKHDLVVIRKLKNQGWNVIICWECEILRKQPLITVIDNILHIDYK
jgi:DNA mismatch endonuclease (patch repair protein)